MTKLEELAAMPCQECGGTGTLYRFRGTNKLTPQAVEALKEVHKEGKCPACNGTGALVPGLRKKCPKCRGKGQIAVPQFGGPPQEHYPCPICEGRTWIPLPEDKAFLVMVQWWVHSYQWLSIDKACDLFHPSDSDFVVSLKSNVLDKAGKGSTPAQALADALVRAVGK